MQFDLKTMILIALIVAAPVLIAAFSVNRHVGRFIRDVEREEQEALLRERSESENKKSVADNGDDTGVCE
jgi:H+/gluconate symporter-like permease